MIYTLYLVDDNSNITETISLDVINSFGENYSSSIAQNAVENGYVISDSISINNPKFAISGVITDSKFRVKGHLVVFNGNTFEKSQGDNREQFQQISDDDYADKVKDRLIKLWENKEVFGILESKDINNVKGSQVRNIFPCALSSLSFDKSSADAALYPTMSIEKIRYAVVTVSTVKNPVPELVAKYEEQQKVGNANTTSVANGVKTPDEKTPDYAAEAKKSLGNLNGSTETGDAVAKTKLNAEYANKQAYANAIDGTKNSVKKGANRLAEIDAAAKESFDRAVKNGEVEDGAKFIKKNW